MSAIYEVSDFKFITRSDPSPSALQSSRLNLESESAMCEASDFKLVSGRALGFSSLGVIAGSDWALRDLLQWLGFLLSD